MLTLQQLFVIIGLLLALLELVMGIATGFDLVIIGTILIIGGLFGNIFQSSLLTLGLSTLLGIAYLYLGRSLLKQKLIIVTKHTNIDKLIGKTGIVVRSITPDTPGLVRVDDEDWRASSEDVLYEKDKVTIKLIEGVTLIVQKQK